MWAMKRRGITNVTYMYDTGWKGGKKSYRGREKYIYIVKFREDRERQAGNGVEVI
jgi:hypothetical protein